MSVFQTYRSLTWISVIPCTARSSSPSASSRSVEVSSCSHKHSFVSKCVCEHSDVAEVCVSLKASSSSDESTDTWSSRSNCLKLLCTLSTEMFEDIDRADFLSRPATLTCLAGFPAVSKILWICCKLCRSEHGFPVFTLAYLSVKCSWLIVSSSSVSHWSRWLRKCLLR